MYELVVYKRIMGRFFKVVLLTLLLIRAGVPGTASPLCAQSTKAPAHACCMGHDQAAASECGSASMQSDNLCNCESSQTDSAPLQNMPTSSSSYDSTFVLKEVFDIAGNFNTPLLASTNDSQQLEKLQHSPLHALLCTFLV
jgi:hypothetical protein